MKNKENDIEDLFRKRFGNDETPVSDKVWENIKGSLPPEKPGRKFPYYLLAILLLGITAGGYLLNKTFQSSEESAVALNDKEKLSSLENTNESNQADHLNNRNNASENQEYSNQKSSENLKKEAEKNFLENGTNFSHNENTSSNKNLINSKENRKSNINTKNSKETGKSAEEKSNLNKDSNKKVKNRKNLGMNSREFSNEKNSNNTSEGIVSSEPFIKETASKTTKHQDKENPSLNDQRAKNDPQINDQKQSNTNEKLISNNDYSNTNTTTLNNTNENIITDFKNNPNNNLNKNDQSNNQVVNLDETGRKDEQITLMNNDEYIMNTSGVNPDSTQNKESDSTVVKNEPAKNDSTGNKEDKKREKKNLDLHFSLDLLAIPAYTNISNNLSDDANKSGRFNLGGGARFNVGLGEKFGAAFGMGYMGYSENYSHTQREVKLYTVYSYDTIWFQNGQDWTYYLSVDSSQKERIINREYKGKNYFRFVELPVAFSYQILSTQKLNIGITAGASFNFLIKGERKISATDSLGIPQAYLTESTGENSPFKPFMLGAFINPSIAYHFREQWAVFAEPGFKFLLGSIHKNESVSVRPYAFNINVGLRYIIK